MNKKTADIVGLLSAVLCIIHCLLLPTLIIYGVANNQFLERWEHLDWLFIAVSGIAIYLANRHESKHSFASVMWSVWSAFALALSLHELHEYFLYFSVAASIALALLHVLHFQKRHLRYSC